MSEIYIPPYSGETEEAVLGSLLIDSEAISKVFLKPEAFYVVKNQWVYQAMLDLHERHEPIDFLTVSQELEKAGRLDEIGGESFIAQLTTAVPTALNVEAYAKAVEGLWIRRKMITAAGDVARIAYDQSLEIGEVIGNAQSRVLDVGKSSTDGKMLPVKHYLNEIWGQIEGVFENPDEPRGIPYCYPVIDSDFGNIRFNNFVVIGARPGVGKSALMLSTALRQAKVGYSVLFYPYEMSPEELTYRLLAQETGFEYDEIEKAKRRDGYSWRPMTAEELSKIVDAMGRLALLPLYFQDEMPTVDALKASITRAKSTYNIPDKKLIVYCDYLQIMTTSRKLDGRVNELGHITRLLKQTARELHIPIVVGSQLNREVEKRADARPNLSDLRESGSTEQDADVVIFIYRDEMYNPDTTEKGIAEISFKKNRNGRNGLARLFWNAPRIAFESLVTEKIEL